MEGIRYGRLAAVRRFDILDFPPDGAFDRVCALAARFFEVPVATVTIVDEDRIWCKAREGLDVVELPREPGLCASAMFQDDPYARRSASLAAIVMDELELRLAAMREVQHESESRARALQQ